MFTNIIERCGRCKNGYITKEIDEALTKENDLASIADLLHALRNVGNYSAHLQNDKSTGMIINVETGEAELLLKILEALFDYHFVFPANIQKEEMN